MNQCHIISNENELSKISHLLLKASFFFHLFVSRVAEINIFYQLVNINQIQYHTHTHKLNHAQNTLYISIEPVLNKYDIHKK